MKKADLLSIWCNISVWFSIRYTIRDGAEKVRWMCHVYVNEKQESDRQTSGLYDNWIFRSHSIEIWICIENIILYGFINTAEICIVNMLQIFTNGMSHV